MRPRRESVAVPQRVAGSITQHSAPILGPSGERLGLRVHTRPTGLAVPPGRSRGTDHTRSRLPEGQWCAWVAHPAGTGVPALYGSVYSTYPHQAHL